MNTKSRTVRRLETPASGWLPWIVSILLFCGCGPTGQTTLSGRVVGVADGDTIRVLVDRREVKVRLFGIDCPESNQAFGTQAKKFTSGLAFGRDVQVISRGEDRYGRVLGYVLLPDGTNLNEEIVRHGMGWWYEQYAEDEFRLKGLQALAKRGRVGLWRDKRPMPPWEFRRLKR